MVTMSAQVSVVGLVESHLDSFAVAAARQLGEVVGVAVTMVSTGGEPRTVGASNPLVRRVDEGQVRVGQGPCLDALAGRGAPPGAGLAPRPPRAPDRPAPPA